MPFTLRLAGTALLASVACQAVTIVSYPAVTALENIVVAPNGELFVTAINKGTIYEVSPSGASSVFGTVPGTLLGISRDLDGTIVANSVSSFYRFSNSGVPSLVAQIPGTQGLNGMALFSSGVFLVADSLKATIWEVNTANGSVRPWLTDRSLAIVPGAATELGANGIKVFEGAVYVSNTSSALVLRIPILPDGSAGKPQVYASNLSLDDFAFAANGTLFGATQSGNSVVRLGTDGSRATIATEADGLLGDAAIAFGRTPADSEDIYVVNNGGAYANLPEGPQPGSIVRLNLGISGAIPESQAVPEPATFLPALAVVLAGVYLLFRKRYCTESPARNKKLQSVDVPVRHEDGIQ